MSNSRRKESFSSLILNREQLLPFFILCLLLFYGRIGVDVLFSRDTLPPLVLVVHLRYSTTDSRAILMDSLISGTRSLVLVGSGVPYFHQRRTTDADNPNQHHDQHHPGCYQRQPSPGSS